MPLGCDCYPGCWGAHSVDWPLIVGEWTKLRPYIHKVVPYGSWVQVPEGVRIELPYYYDALKEVQIIGGFD